MDARHKAGHDELDANVRSETHRNVAAVSAGYGFAEPTLVSPEFEKPPVRPQ